MREELLGLIPEFNLIEDADLREKCIQTWLVAMEEYGWTPQDLLRLPFTLLIDPCPANFIEHMRAVTLTALGAAEAMREIYGDHLPINMDYLLAGALLHDIGKLVEYEFRPDGLAAQSRTGTLLRHPFTGMHLAARSGLPAEVLHMIAVHAAEGDKVKRSIEATIINHADFINFESLKRAQEGSGSAARLKNTDFKG
ncbi:MAG: HDIG domain-containing metalloprotein [Anaerolineae bacterium]